MLTDETIMARCLQNAEQALRAVAPNPMVGACLVHQGRIIAEGIHERYGEAHAEVNAIRKVSDPALLAACTLYVTLEPCSHFGKTPPCADLIIKSGIRSVVVATRDPNPEVAGAGIQRLRDHGISIKEDVLRDEARTLNRRFLTAHLRKRPYIILKWAETADGFIARSDYSSRWISGEDSRDLVHRWRSIEQAIIVGARTAQCDDPQLTVRNGSGKNPLRVVFDRDLSLPPGLNLWDSAAATLRFSTVAGTPSGSEEIVTLRKDTPILQQIAAELYNRKINSLMVEGGAATLNWFLQENLWDEARIFTSKDSFRGGIPAPSKATLIPAVNKPLIQSEERLKNDSLRILFNQNLATMLQAAEAMTEKTHQSR